MKVINRTHFLPTIQLKQISQYHPSTIRKIHIATDIFHVYSITSTLEPLKNSDSQGTSYFPFEFKPVKKERKKGDVAHWPPSIKSPGRFACTTNGQGIPKFCTASRLYVTFSEGDT
jgi:hypothetical protein